MADLMEIVGMHDITASETGSINYAVLPNAKGVPMQVRIQYVNALLATGSGTVTCTAKTSVNEGGTWTTAATGAAITLSTTAADGEQTLSFTPASTSDAGQLWVQVLAAFAGTNTGAAIGYRADLVLAHPLG